MATVILNAREILREVGAQALRAAESDDAAHTLALRAQEKLVAKAMRRKGVGEVFEENGTRLYDAVVNVRLPYAAHQFRWVGRHKVEILEVRGDYSVVEFPLHREVRTISNSEFDS